MPTLWELSLDNGLMMLALFCIMYAFLGMFSKSNQNAANGGIITLIVTSIVAGVGLGTNEYHRQQLQVLHKLVVEEQR